MKLYLGILFILALLISSCRTKTTTNHSIKGVWKSFGSGLLLEIKDSSSYSFYDITSISCLPNHNGEFSELQELLEIKNDTLSLLEEVITYKYTKVQKLPKLCIQNWLESIAKDPLYNFEVFSETVKEHYAFMELNGINSKLWI